MTDTNITETDLESLRGKVPQIKEFLLARIAADVELLRNVGVSPEDIIETLGLGGPKRGRPPKGKAKPKSVQQTAA